MYQLLLIPRPKLRELGIENPASKAHVIHIRPPCASKMAPSECYKNLHTFSGPFLNIFRLCLSQQSIWPFDFGVWNGIKGAFEVHLKERQREQ
jgi:hypothetical protein